jgi:two-component system, response regulator
MTPPPDLRPIVVADDDADDLFFARRSLQKAGITATVLTCADGNEVVALLKAINQEHKPVPRAIFLDIKMPNLDGFQTLKWIREQKHLRDVGVVMLSGSNEARDVALARSLGADDYLVKYPTPADFSRAVAVADSRK